MVDPDETPARLEWWLAEDNSRVYHVGAMAANLPISLEEWRTSGLADRPHP
jgi:hypothetical protein